MCSSSSDLPNPLPHSPPRAFCPLRLSQPRHHNTTITTAKQPWLPPPSPPQPPTMGACGFKPPPSSSSPHHCHHRHPLVTATIVGVSRRAAAAIRGVWLAVSPHRDAFGL
ncbi:hypothetical protein Tco_0906899 [Tanacetum coccineum]|uniref:Uncharacterized protein n=1 Tax=Tanacetum coccineum TaxID=301880 RepID=A0ABQ5CP06_9ASTR